MNIIIDRSNILLDFNLVYIEYISKKITFEFLFYFLKHRFSSW
uniref:Uncharacterized protein n=1 Tax=Siphoviridae sp. ct1is2 TaxID=2826273 RepID=A0A8S5NP92_9CAUD|nr:MAG TPA: hypothetical protein [Siphoviridae sp. ct1is2]